MSPKSPKKTKKGRAKSTPPKSFFLALIIIFSLLALAEIAGHQLLVWWQAYQEMNTITYSP